MTDFSLKLQCSSCHHTDPLSHSWLNYPTAKLEAHLVVFPNHVMISVSRVFQICSFLRIRKPRNPLTLVSVTLTRQKRF